MSENRKANRLAVVFPLFLMALTSVYLAAAFNIRTQFTADGGIGPRTIPILAASLMYVALLIVIVQEWRAAPKRAEAFDLRSFGRPVLVVVATAAFILLFRPLGYCLSTLAFVLVLFAIFEFELKRPVVLILSALMVTAIFYGLFALLFGIRLPTLTEGFI